jgi:beta-xylosidase
MKKIVLLLLSAFLWLPVEGQNKNPFGHALVPDMIADASIQLIGDTFYCFATTDGYGRGLETSGPPVVWKSKDFQHWSFDGICFPSAAQEKYWAPSKAIERDGHWYIYPTVNGYMHVGVADNPDGPFLLAHGQDKFEKPFTPASTLKQGDDRGGIDAEVFIDDDGQAYAFWGGRHVARLDNDMRTLGEIRTIETRRKEYSEGPIFFKRKGIYYYLYTIGGDENYEYYYQMSRTSPLGPYETPTNDLVSTTCVERGVFGPGHGCVFNDGDNYYFAFLEFGRRSTNRQTYVNKLEFNNDGTIRQVAVSLDGVGALRHIDDYRKLRPVIITASSTRKPHAIRYQNDRRCQRTEHFDAAFAIDGANGSRWMAADGDSVCWMVLDLGKNVGISRSEICFVRPTAGHAYLLEGSQDGIKWKRCGGHTDVQQRSPHTDDINKNYRYLRVTITNGIRGIWEWRVLSNQKADERMSLQQPDVVWGDWQQWGELPDGTYRNPVIPADYSDLDCIRVGDDYYAISSTMQFSPGMTILHSRDLVNWEIAGNAVTDLTQISPALGWQQMDRYGRGIWAGTLRYHNNRFYLFFGTPDEGYFMTSAPRAEGPWEPLTTLMAESGWDDCSAIWDEQGHTWFVGTCFREGYKTYLFPMADDAHSIDRNSARLINEGNGREANKLIFHDGYYYLVFSEHRDGIGRYVMAKRDRKMTGKFREECQLLLPCREAHEPNQGGIIEGPDGKWYFLTHHGSGDWSGRIFSLLPVEWSEGWPMIGDTSQGVPGRMVWSAAMPARLPKLLHLQRSDDFDTTSLSPQWQWNYQPRQDMFSLSERPGWLRLKAFRPLAADKLLKVGNTLSQRSFRSNGNEVTVKIDISHMTEDTHAGLCHFAQHSGCLGVAREGGQTYLELRLDDRIESRQPINSTTLWLRSTWGLDGLSHFYYSLDGDLFAPFGDYPLSWGYYRGDRIGIYCYNNRADEGYIDIDYLHYQNM